MDFGSDDQIRKAMLLAQTPAGQQLIQLLQQNGGEDLQQAMDLAAAGDYSQAKQALSALMKDPQMKALLSQLGR